MKGLAIHVEQLIIIIVAVLVLLALITFFLGIWNPKSILYRAKLTQACQVLQNEGCATEVLNNVDQPTTIKEKEVGGSGDSPLRVIDVCGYVLTGIKNGASKEQCLKACACMT